MICKSTDLNVAVLDSLKKNHYSRRIKSHFQSYGTAYDFARFFEILYDERLLGIICIFNSSMIISTYENAILDYDMVGEIAGFIQMNKPCSIELEKCYADKIHTLLEDDYTFDIRTEFEFVSRNSIPQMQVDVQPRLDDVFEILKESFHTLGDSYELWLTDTSHRIRRNLSRVFMVKDCTTATIQYIVDNAAIVGQVATTTNERGKHHARRLLYWIGEQLASEGLTVKLFARPHRVSYYEEILFKEIGTDIVLERKLDK